MKTRISLGVIAIVVFQAVAQHRGPPVIGRPGNPGIPGTPTRPIYQPRPVQPGFGRGTGGGAFRHHGSSNSFVGTVPYLVPIPVDTTGGADDEQSPPIEDPPALQEPFSVQPPPTRIVPPAPPPATIEPQAPTGSADRTCIPVVQEDPVHFFIALKNGTVLVGVAYWVIDGTLHYLSLEGGHNQVSLELIDRALSARMNERGRVPLILPK